jgi:hypothetical protein
MYARWPSMSATVQALRSPPASYGIILLNTSKVCFGTKLPEVFDQRGDAGEGLIFGRGVEHGEAVGREPTKLRHCGRLAYICHGYFTQAIRSLFIRSINIKYSVY